MIEALQNVFPRVRKICAPASLKRRKIRYAPALGAVLLLTVACGAGEQTGSAEKSPTEKPEITFGLKVGPVSLDPAKDGTGGYLIMRALTNESLIHQEPDGSFSPGLATEWGYVGTGNKEFELTLREGARFSDGEPVTAEAVKKWLEYFAAANGPNLEFLDGIESIEAVDESTVRIQLEQANPIVPWVLSDQNNWGAVSSPEALKSPKILGTETYGAGPYVLDVSQTVGEDHYTFVPNKYYYDQSAIRFSKITAKIISTPTSMLQAVNAGQVDVAQGDATTADAVSQGIEVLHEPASVVVMTLDRGGVVSKPLADLRVRQALNFAVNRAEIAKAMFGEYGSPATQMGSADGFNPEDDDFYSYDPEKAKSLLAEAGYADGFTAEVLVSSANSQSLMQAVAQDLKDVGVDLKLKTPNTQAEWVQELEGNETFPMLQAGMTLSRPMWSQYGLYLKEKSIYNRLGTWSDPEIDKLFNEGQNAEDPASYWTRITKRATEQAHFLPILSVDGIYYVSEDIEGVSLSDSRALPVATEWSPR